MLKSHKISKINKKIGTPSKKVKPNESGDDVSEF